MITYFLIFFSNPKSQDCFDVSELLQQGLEFHENHGRNVQLKSNNTTAIRTDSYNQGELLWITQLLPEKLVKSNKSISQIFF